MKKNHNKNTILLLLAIIFSISTITVIILLLNGKKTITNNSNAIVYSVDSILCTTTNKNHSFFDISQATNVKKTITITFKDDFIDAIMYTLDAEYPNSDTAKIEEAELRAHYSKFMSSNGYDPDLISNTFSLHGTKAKTKLYTHSNNISEKTSKLFLLDDQNLKSNKDSILSHYKSLSFTCSSK